MFGIFTRYVCRWNDKSECGNFKFNTNNNIMSAVFFIEIFQAQGVTLQLWQLGVSAVMVVFIVLGTVWGIWKSNKKDMDDTFDLKANKIEVAKDFKIMDGKVVTIDDKLKDYIRGNNKDHELIREDTQYIRGRLDEFIDSKK